ncbi:hypothetical protein [Luteolibacter pohnpeiensis]|nr:hypothetical protein [Luteolibacter pohnpeiensis]
MSGLFGACDRGRNNRATSDGGTESIAWSGGTPSGWEDLAKPMAEYSSAEPNRPKIVSIGATWCTMSLSPWRTFSQPAVRSALLDAGYRCLVADVTNGHEVASAEVERLGLNAMPVVATFDPTTGEWTVRPQYFREEDVLDWVRVQKLRLAEKSVGGRSATPLRVGD